MKCWAKQDDPYSCSGRAKTYLIKGNAVVLCRHHAIQYQTGRYSLGVLLARHYGDPSYLRNPETEDELDKKLRRFGRKPKRKYARESTVADYQALADVTAERLGVKPVEIRVKDVQGGHADTVKGYIVIPAWTKSRGYAYWVYYVVHELCHFAEPPSGEGMHTTRFKQVEREALSWWDIEIEYARAYPERLWHKGKLVYQRKK